MRDVGKQPLPVGGGVATDPEKYGALVGIGSGIRLPQLYAFLAVRFPKSWLERRQPPVGDTRSSARRGGRTPPEENRRRWIRSWRDVTGAPLPLEGLARPRQAKQLADLADGRPAVRQLAPEHRELGRSVPATDPQNEATAAEDLRDGGVFGELDGIVEGGEENRGAKPNAPGARGHGAGENERGGVIAVLGGVMFAESDEVETQFVRPRHLVQGGLVEIARPGPESRSPHVVDDGFFHARESIGISASTWGWISASEESQ